MIIIAHPINNVAVAIAAMPCAFTYDRNSNDIAGCLSVLLQEQASKAI